MSFTLFTAEFTDISDEDWKIKVVSSGTASDWGNTFNVGPDGFRLTYDFDQYDRCKPVIGSRVQLTMYQDDTETSNFESFYDLLAAVEEGVFRIEIYKDQDATNTLFWVGEILPEQTVIPDEFPNAAITLTAVDGLANLKGIKYNNDGAAYTGTATVLGHLHNLIQKLHVSEIWTASDVELKFFEDFIGKEYKTYIDSGGLQNQQLHNAKITHDTYYKKDEDNNNEYFSAYEVLESLALTFNACVFMSEGVIWWVPLGAIQSHASAGLSIANYMLGNGTVTYNTGANTTIGAIFGSNSAQWEKLAGWERSTVPSFKKVIRSRDYQGTRSLVSDSLYTRTDLVNETVLDDVDIEYAIGERLCISGTFHYVAGSFGYIANDLDRVARLNLKIKLKLGDGGGAVKYIKRGLGFSTDNTEFVGYINFTSSGFPTYNPLDPIDSLEINSGISGPLTWDNSISFYEILSTDFDKIVGTYDPLVGYFPIPLTIPFEIVTEPLTAASTGLQLSATLEGKNHLGAADATLTAATNTSGAINYRIDNFRVNRYSSEQSQEFSSIDITATNPATARYDFQQPSTLIGDRISDFDLGIITVNNGSVYIEPTEWSSLQSSTTSLSINSLGVRERLGANLSAIRTESGTLYKRGSTWIHPYSVLTNTEDSNNFYQVSGLTFIAARSEYDIECMYLTRNITGIVLAEDNPINKGPSIPVVVPSTKLVQSNGGIVQEHHTKLGFITTDTYGITKVTTSTGGAGLDINLPISKATTGIEVIGINASGAMAPVADGSSGQFLKTDGSGVLSWAAAGGGGGGWFGSTTLLKVMPSEFMGNDDPDRTYQGVVIDDDTSGYLGARAFNLSTEMFVMKAIPQGYKATHVYVYTSSAITSGVTVYRYKHNTGEANSYGTGNTNASIDITDITSSTTDNICIKVATASATIQIYGADITISAV